MMSGVDFGIFYNLKLEEEFFNLQIMKVSIIGGGSWGTTIGSLVSENADTILWCRSDEVSQDINSKNRNSRYLKKQALPKQLRATTDLAECLEKTQMVIMAVPSQGFRSILSQIAGNVDASVPVISLTKGLERVTQLRMTQVINEVMPENPTGVLTGPNIALEVLEGHATASVAVSEDESIAMLTQEVVSVPTFRVYTHTDVVGAEIGGALKNVIALAAGMVEGLNKGDNTRATVITRGLAELTRLGIAMGGRTDTLAGLAGMGDLIVTSISPKSRNRFVGQQLGKGESLKNVMDKMDQVAEGVFTTEVALQLAAKHGVEMPISEAVQQVVSGESDAVAAYEDLLKREMRSEQDFPA